MRRAWAVISFPREQIEWNSFISKTAYCIDQCVTEKNWISQHAYFYLTSWFDFPCIYILPQALHNLYGNLRPKISDQQNLKPQLKIVSILNTCMCQKIIIQLAKVTARSVFGHKYTR